MKISGKIIHGKCYSLLFTGYANGDTIDDIIEEYYIIKYNHSKENLSCNNNTVKKKKK